MMSIWFKEVTLEEVNALRRNTLLEHLDIRFVEIGENELRATMPVDRRTVQPMGLLHGGASAALAESLGSVAATLCVNTDKHYCVGLEINANHIRPVRQGTVTGVARPIHIGKTTQVWEIKIYDRRDKLVCISRITLAVKNR
ncbi:MAG TPA: hotdog fold thioesterase [Caldithrix sp.]|nr:hotdog fold thioesterase [Caldithrix sp.]